jgi:hypothetical protein
VAKSSTLAFRPPAVMRQESSCATARVLVPSVSFAGVPSVRSGGVATPLVILSHVAIPGFEGRFVGVNGSAIFRLRHRVHVAFGVGARIPLGSQATSCLILLLSSTGTPVRLFRQSAEVGAGCQGPLERVRFRLSF